MAERETPLNETYVADLVEALDRLGSELLGAAYDLEKRLTMASGKDFFKGSGTMEIGVGDRRAEPYALSKERLDFFRENYRLTGLSHVADEEPA